VGPGGRLVLENRAPLVADYVLTQPEIGLLGRRVATGTGAGLVLWETDRQVTLTDPGLRAADIASADCG
ncbi:MAG TPA: hypothetical protein VFQ28_04755, partial [Gaiella sp.]|nr:hypothetical protein [Gaiella sp.]